MLAYILAIAVALGSFVLFMAAFLFPEVHRKSDFLWSGVAMFYALVLWICAGRITGGVLLGQTASVALLGWLGWETLNLRRATTAAESKTVISPEARETINRLSPNTLFAPIANRFRKPKPATAPVESVATLVEEPQLQDLESLADRVVSPPPPPEEERGSVAEPASEVAPESEASAILRDASRGAQSIAPPPEVPLEAATDREETETLEVSTLVVEQVTSVETGEVLSETVELAIETLEVSVEEAPSLSDVETSESFIPLETESDLSAKESSATPLEAPSEEEEWEEDEEPAAALQATPPKPPTLEAIEAAKESKKNGSSEPPTPVKEFAPEVDLAPYAEPPDRE